MPTLGRRAYGERAAMGVERGGRWWLEKVIHLGQRASSALFHRKCGSFRLT